MSVIDEAALWERLSQSRRNPLDPSWLGETYSPSLSAELRAAISEQLGLMAGRGWPVIATLIERFGPSPDLVHAAGLCHQEPARDWLLTQLRQNEAASHHADPALLDALQCWGAALTLSELTPILQAPSQSMRLTGLRLLRFKAHQLDAPTLLSLCAPCLEDWRDPVTVAAIRLLQRRDDPSISEALAQIGRHGSEASAQAALKALGCIATPHSRALLQALADELPPGERQRQAMRQLEQQLDM
ncbi:hypothetical protein SynWH8101_2821 [Synechococcus sp. WH 8101]|uniref:HEAT repeat domain-containing protein n=1 Tax=Synechococcus sp. WH 8101 TaxID=59932 RepID=UPI00102384B1|nr:HEAT repeat domain-containing protein [Synechococcus sp. WH 8101]QBE70386.1 hypothetical protein SynWH8101_2821 [Synechococcus sp. WH 8101]QNI46662.1 Armadillo-like helical-containing protein [Synechococcus sp. WH 8101]